MMWDYGHGAGWEGWLLLVFMIVFVIAIVIAVILLVRYLAHSQGAQMQAPGSQQAAAAPPQTAPVTPPAETPQDILKRRYASGEIEREEYLQKLDDLQS